MTDLLTANDRPGEYPASLYRATANPYPATEALAGTTKADVTIIGGGYTGLSAAIHLARRGVDVAVIEANRVGWGASGRNGGQIGSGLRADQFKLERMVGQDRARALWDLSVEAKATLRGLIAEHGIACDLKRGQLHADHKPQFVGESHRYAEHLATAYGYSEAEPASRDDVRAMLSSDAYFGGLMDWGAGHLHPLNYALGLAHAAQGLGVRIFERSRVVSVSEGTEVTVRTDNGAVVADKVLYALNGYHCDLENGVAGKVMPINNYLVATEPLGEAKARELNRDDVCIADSRFVVNYFRMSADNRLVFGGGESYGYRFPADIDGLVMPNLLSVYPQLKGVRIDYRWGGTLGITSSRMPHFATLSPRRISAAGFSGHGVPIATLAGRLAAEKLVGEDARFDLMASVRNLDFPGGRYLRHPLLVLAMTWYAIRDRL